jgi:multisubunit Na+/H+ antiporter MnhG subunit
MIGPWRGWAVAVGGILAIAGIVLWLWGGGPMLLIVGAVALVTALIEPIYGRATARAPHGGGWRPTDERFVDPETNEPVTVWFDAATGERRYVTDAPADRN